MRVEIILNQVWADIEHPTFDTNSQPASLILPISFNHIFSDRYTEFSLKLRLELKFSKIKVGSQILHLELPPGMRNEKYDIEFLLLPELSQLIESERERSRVEDITWVLKIEGKIRYRYATGGFAGENPINISCEFKTPITEWKKVLGLIDYQLILLPRELVDELETLRKKWGFWKIDDVIMKFLDVYKGEQVGISQQFLVTFYETKSIRDKLAEFADKSANFREVRVASLYLDNTGAEYLIKMLKNKVKIKLLTRKKGEKAHEDALSILKQLGAEIRYDNMLHARLIIFDDIAAIISSADLDSEGLNNQKQAGILSFDKIVVRDAITFFDKAWEMAEKA
jgi:hypothetical protein